MSGALSSIPDSLITPLEWQRSQRFHHPNMVRIKISTSGSSLFHAIASAYIKPYILGTINGVSLDKNEYIRKLRNDLATRLAEKNSLNVDSPTVYEELHHGKLKKQAERDPKFSLEEMQNRLRSNDPVGPEFHEFISNELEKDIYILDLLRHDVHALSNDMSLFVKGRFSIVLLYVGGNYDLIGIQNNKQIITCFDPTDEFIQQIRSRVGI